MSSTYRVRMPSTCTYQSVLATGVCSGQYTGVKSLLGVDITLRGRARKCASGSWEVYLGCKGTDCFLLNNYKLCSSDADCTATTACGNIPVDAISFFNNNYRSYYDPYTTHSYYTTYSTSSSSSSNIYDYTSTYDADDYYYYKTPLFSYFWFTPLFPYVQYAPFRQGSKCFTNVNEEIFHDIKNVLRSLKGLPKDEVKNYSEKYMCSVDQQFIINANLTAWGQTQITTDAEFITLKELTEWQAGGSPIETKVVPIPVDEITENGVLKYSSLVISLLSLLVVLI